MADVTTINGYNVKDSTARSGIASEEAARKSQVSAINRVLEKGFAKQIREIDAKASGILYLEDVDDDTEYEKDVQSKVLPLAAVDVVGGRTVVWNQLVDSAASSVTVTSGHIYVSKIGGTWSRATSGGAAIAVTGGTDCIFDLTAMFGARNEPSTVAEFRAMFPSDYYAYSANTLLNADVVNVKSVGKNLCSGRLVGKTLTTAGVVTTASTYDLCYAPVSEGETYAVTNGATTTLLGFFTDEPTVSSVTYDGAIRANSAANMVFTAPINGWVAFRSATGYATPQLEKGSTATTYSPYTTASLPIPSAARALCPLYGASAGSAYNYIDWDARVYHQRVASVDLGTLTWVYETSTSRFRTRSLIGTVKTYSSIGKNMVCTRFTAASTTADKTMFTNTDGTMYFYDSSYTDATAFTTALSGVYLYYELATEVTVDLSSVLTADNFIEVEAGGTITLENSHGDTYRIPVPSTETYEIDVNL